MKIQLICNSCSGREADSRKARLIEEGAPVAPQQGLSAFCLVLLLFSWMSGLGMGKHKWEKEWERRGRRSLKSLQALIFSERHL